MHCCRQVQLHTKEETKTTPSSIGIAKIGFELQTSWVKSDHTASWDTALAFKTSGSDSAVVSGILLYCTLVDIQSTLSSAVPWSSSVEGDEGSLWPNGQTNLVMDLRGLLCYLKFFKTAAYHLGRYEHYLLLLESCSMAIHCIVSYISCEGTIRNVGYDMR